MPIKGFNSVGEQSKEEVIKIYGRKPTKPDKRYSLIIPCDLAVPYICDKTGTEFSLKWRKLQYSLNVPHYYNHCGCNRHTLTDEDKLFIEENYPVKGFSFCINSLNISSSSLYKYTKEKGIKRHKNPDGFKTCSKCKRVLSTENFYLVDNKKRLNGQCKECNSESNKNYSDNCKSTLEGKRMWTANGLLAKCRKRAETLNIPFDIDINWIILNMGEKCPVLNIPYIFCGGKTFAGSPSIDRIIPKLGYTKENSRIISFRANNLKSDASLEEVRLVLKYLEENIK